MRVLITFLVSFLILATPTFAAIDDFSEGMSQDNFAMLLVQELEIEAQLPTAAIVTDYFRLLRNIGIEPADGWDVDAVITKEDLVHMLGVGKDEVSGQSFAGLLEQLINRLQDTVWAQSGARPAASPFIQ